MRAIVRATPAVGRDRLASESDMVESPVFPSLGGRDEAAPDPQREQRSQRLQRTLMESTDDAERARAHLELARLAVADGRVEGSVRHLREALLLDRRLDAARALLVELGETSRVAAVRGDGVGGARKGAVRALLGRLRRG